MGAEEAELEEVVEGEEAGYRAQELDGIGGAVKAKGWMKVRIGASVKEWDGGVREGRMWCGWCDRVVLAGSDGVDGVVRW